MDAQPDSKPVSAPYGLCPECGAPGMSRTRGGKNSMDTCENGHKYLSMSAKTAVEPECPEEYGYNLTEDRRVAMVDWDEPDLQIGRAWNKGAVVEFLGLPKDAVVYRTLADTSDLHPSLAEEEDGDSGGYDWSELQSRRSSPPPIVVTRTSNGSIVINDGNHRAKFWIDSGKQYIPCWCYDELITEWTRRRASARPSVTAARRSRFQVLKDNKERLDGEEREKAMKAKAVWHSGPKGEAQCAVWKSKDSSGKVVYVCNTHRCFQDSPTLDGAIKLFHDEVKHTACFNLRMHRLASGSIG